VKVFADGYAADTDGESLEGTVVSAAYAGDGFDLRLDIGGGAILRAQTGKAFAASPTAGQRLRVGWNSDDARILRQ
jgi:hypothetical protein